MKTVFLQLTAVSFLLLLNSCFTTGMLQKGSYISYDKVYINNISITDLTTIASYSLSDKTMYENIAEKIQSTLALQQINCNNTFLTAGQGATAISQKIAAGSSNFFLIINPVKDSYERDEMNNPFILKQVVCVLQNKKGEHIADFSVRIEREEAANKMGKEIGAVILEFLKKNNFIK